MESNITFSAYQSKRQLTLVLGSKNMIVDFDLFCSIYMTRGAFI